MLEDRQCSIQQEGMYSPSYEHDACGVGFIAHLRGVKSHDLVQKAVIMLQNLVHRGAVGDDGRTGDGAGILVQIPDLFLRKIFESKNIILPPLGSYGVGMFFFPSLPKLQEVAKEVVIEECEKADFSILHWRDVPVNPDCIGDVARGRQPYIVQMIVHKKGVSEKDLERQLYILRRRIEKSWEDRLKKDEQPYVVSLSSRTIVYKGMMVGTQLSDFYEDLRNELFQSSLAVIHQRYSTNTFPSWALAQPFRYLAHNGEINTLRGNKNQMKAREKMWTKLELWEGIGEILPVLNEEASDSACLDAALELLVQGGRALPLSAMILMPQAWGPKYPIGPELRGFFDYYSGIMEPWDGPAAVTFTDGRVVGAILDRNGLRPVRYTITNDGLMVLASETGVLDFPPDQVVEKGGLRPGQIILADIPNHRVLHDAEIKSFYAKRLPYRRWVEENRIQLRGFYKEILPPPVHSDSLSYRQLLFGYTREDLSIILNTMASTGHEPVGSMGNDTPLAVLSEKPQLLYSYFKQLFAQVTNPPIDSIREELVMSLMSYLGRSADIFFDSPKYAQLIKLPHPILSYQDIDRLRNLKHPDILVHDLPIGFPAQSSVDGLEESLMRLCIHATQYAMKGRVIFILTDRNLPADYIPIPALLAVSAINQYLIREGVACNASFVVETGEMREVHHLALLVGYGAHAIYPYLAMETIASLASNKLLDKEVDSVQAIDNYVHALNKGLLKVMSKMGISTLRSYRGAQIFEAVGINQEVIDRFFTGTASRIQGIGLREIAQEAIERYHMAERLSKRKPVILPVGGQYRWSKEGERHLWTPEAITQLQYAVRNNDVNAYRRYAQIINDQSKNLYTLRGLFTFRPTNSIPLDEVEPVENIIRRFVTGAMSFGSISKEAHETLAIAMNQIGAKSNSGEGGEDPERYRILPDGKNRCSAIKQVASGRFGVTIEYLVNAKELQIKIAQGAKPGEGGQLPGHKVDKEIAKVRHSVPGVTLISPPPHHDIYSIEDLKQLIFDLKNANPEARISVKLVAEVGVGTIAAGVAKAKADMILISGYDGGTGASPLSSIKHAGIPWELGLAETQQTLVKNRLRDRVVLQCDGQMKTGRDVVIAALLGAEEFGFATAALVSMGCVMMRKCHDNTCPVGIATQNPELRRRFMGKPEHVINFFRFVAEEVRTYMAQLGFRTMDEMIGRSDLLDTNQAIQFWKAKRLDFSLLFENLSHVPGPRRCVTKQDHELDGVLDWELIEKAKPALENQEKVIIEKQVTNRNRTIGTMLSGVIAKKYGLRGLPDDTITLRLYGCAGQSLGAFGARGITVQLEGEANDYVGKGLSGAKIIIYPPEEASYKDTDPMIAGNVLLYGATSGEVYIAGRVGERFAVRNSGAIAVVEGVGDHGCEYMTGGVVVVLGSTGVNFAAGMSGGIAYVYDPTNTFDMRCNLEMVDLDTLTDLDDINLLRSLIEKHYQYTKSRKAQEILENWPSMYLNFVKVFPVEYRKALGKMSKEDAAVERQELVRE